MLDNYNPHTRYRERSLQRLSQILGFLAVILLSCLLGFWFGKQYGAERLITLDDQVEALSQQRNLLQDSVTELRAEAQTANARYDQLKEELNAMIPEGPMQEIITMVREQLEEGMDAQRLSFLIRSARPPTGCTEPETKRFVVSNPANKGPDSEVSVADGALLISGSGKSASNDKGDPEAWYDPAQSITVVFKTAEKQETKKGVLPLRHSIVVADREYRFTIEEGARSFAKVVFDSCAYP